MQIQTSACRWSRSRCRCRDAEADVERCRVAEVQVQRCKIQRCTGAQVHRCRGVVVQWCTSGAGAQMQRYRDDAVRCRGTTEVQRRCRCAEVQVQRCREV